MEFEGVTQSILADPERMKLGVYGNCVQAAIASLFDLPLDAVPHFAGFNCWSCAIELWARGRGFSFKGNRNPNAPPAGRSIAYGRSPRGYGHVCVAEAGRIIWDPHPSREGLTELQGYYWFEEIGLAETCHLCHIPYPPSG